MVVTKNMLVNTDSLTVIGLVMLGYFILKGTPSQMVLMLALTLISVIRSVYQHIDHYKLTGKIY